MDTFGKRLKKAIEDSGNTYNSIADQVRCTRAHISNLVSDSKKPSQTLVQALSLALAVREEWLSSGKGKKDIHRPDMLNDYEADIISEIRELKEPKRRTTAKMLLAVIKATKDD